MSEGLGAVTKRRILMLLNLRRSGWTYRRIGRAISRSPQRASQLVFKAERIERELVAWHRGAYDDGAVDDPRAPSQAS